MTKQKKQHIFIAIFIAIFIIVFLFYLFLRKIEEKYYYTIAKKIVDNNHSNHAYKLFSGMSEYRIGDMILNEWRFKNKGEDFHYKYFPKSIATEYMKKTKKQNNIKVLQEIIDKRATDKPDIDSLVIHLRIGDVIENSSESVVKMLSKQTYYQPSKIWSGYVKPLKYFDDKLDKCKQYNIKNIIIVAGSHINSTYKKSTLYIDCIKYFLKNKNFNVILRLGNDPDSDLIFMSYAKYFISSGGGYSKLVEKLVKQRGNKII